MVEPRLFSKLDSQFSYEQCKVPWWVWVHSISFGKLYQDTKPDLYFAKRDEQAALHFGIQVQELHRAPEVPIGGLQGIHGILQRTHGCNCAQLNQLQTPKNNNWWCVWTQNPVTEVSNWMMSPIGSRSGCVQFDRNAVSPKSKESKVKSWNVARIL